MVQPDFTGSDPNALGGATGALVAVDVTDDEHPRRAGRQQRLQVGPPGPATVGAQALTEVNLVKISQAGYEQLLNDLPVWASSMMRNFALRLVTMNKRLRDQPQFVGKK